MLECFMIEKCPPKKHLHKSHASTHSLPTPSLPLKSEIQLNNSKELLLPSPTTVLVSSTSISSETIIKCDTEWLEVCFNKAQSNLSNPIFGFAEFIAGFAILIIFFTLTDAIYRFRAFVAPVPLKTLTFISLILIGIFTLLTDIWFPEHWPLPTFLPSQATIQTLLGAVFLSASLTWIYYSFIAPPVYSKMNYKRFAKQLFRMILRGDSTELSAIAYELRLSARPVTCKILSHEPFR